MNTAMSERVIDTMVKLISPAPLSAASCGVAPSSICRTMFSITTTASSTTKPDSDRQRHQGEIIQAIAELVEHREGADQRQRHGHRRYDGRPEVAQEEEDNHHHQSDREHHTELHVGDRGAD